MDKCLTCIYYAPRVVKGRMLATGDCTYKDRNKWTKQCSPACRKYTGRKERNDK